MHVKMLSAIHINLDQSKILLSDNELTIDDKIWVLSKLTFNKISVCKRVMPPKPIHTGRGTVHRLISKELIGKYQCHLRKEQDVFVKH